MLSRRAIGGTVGVFAGLALLLSVLVAGSARADVTPCGLQVCVGAGSSGSPGSPGGGSGGGGGGGGGGGSAECYWQGTSVPCYESGIGWFSSADGCYYMQLQPQPPAGDPLWQGHQPGDGAIYIRTCALGAGGGSVTLWLATPPPGYGGGPTPGQLAQQALSKMMLSAPAIGIAPKHGAMGLVGLPVWLWDIKSQTTWGPNSASASAGGLTVTATAKVSQIVWDMGDGSIKTCKNAGTPYSASYGNSSSPTCGYTYQQSSAGQPGGAYSVTATSTWTVTWSASNGQTGTLAPLTRTSTTTVAIGQLQVLNH